MTGKFLFGCILILALMITHHQVIGQEGSLNNSPEYTVTKKLLSVEDGLASHEVFCGVQDKAGFLWFGTRNGLNRYDGKNCLLFNRQRKKLQDNKVVQLAKDGANQLFIEYGNTGFKLTTNGKVDVMDATTQDVKTLTAAFPNLPFKEQDVYWLSNDGTDEINFLTAHPFRLWKYSSTKGFKLRYEMKEWDKQGALSNLDYRATGPFCMFGKGKAMLKIFNQTTQYLITRDKAISFIQPNAVRSLPIGFSSQNDLLLAYSNTTGNTFSVGSLTDKGDIESVPEQNSYHINQLKGKVGSLPGRCN